MIKKLEYHYDILNFIFLRKLLGISYIILKLHSLYAKETYKLILLATQLRSLMDKSLIISFSSQYEKHIVSIIKNWPKVLM